MELHFTGVLIAVCTFLIIGLFHPLVIKTEYYTGTRLWWVFLVLGLAVVGVAFMVENVFWSSVLGVLGASLLWSIGELFSQRKDEYEVLGEEDSICPIPGVKRSKYNQTITHSSADNSKA